MVLATGHALRSFFAYGRLRRVESEGEASVIFPDRVQWVVFLDRHFGAREGVAYYNKTLAKSNWTTKIKIQNTSRDGSMSVAVENFNTWALMVLETFMDSMGKEEMCMDCICPIFCLRFMNDWPYLYRTNPQQGNLTPNRNRTTYLLCKCLPPIARSNQRIIRYLPLIRFEMQTEKRRSKYVIHTIIVSWN